MFATITECIGPGIDPLGRVLRGLWMTPFTNLYFFRFRVVRAALNAASDFFHGGTFCPLFLVLSGIPRPPRLS